LAKLAEQEPGQLIPAGVLVMVPAPEAGGATESRYVVVVGDGCGFGLEPVPPPQPARSSVVDRVPQAIKIRRRENWDFMARYSNRTTLG
jgi:hypothetical protein